MANIVEDLLVAARLDSQSLTIAPEEIDVKETIVSLFREVPIEIDAAETTVFAHPSRVR